MAPRPIPSTQGAASHWGIGVYSAPCPHNVEAITCPAFGSQCQRSTAASSAHTSYRRLQNVVQDARSDNGTLLRTPS